MIHLQEHDLPLDAPSYEPEMAERRSKPRSATRGVANDTLKTKGRHVVRGGGKMRCEGCRKWKLASELSCNHVFCGDCKNMAKHSLYMLACRENGFEFWRPCEANPPCKKIGKRAKTARWPYAWYKQTFACIEESPHNEIGQMFSEDAWSHWNSLQFGDKRLTIAQLNSMQQMIQDNNDAKKVMSDCKDGTLRFWIKTDDQIVFFRTSRSSDGSWKPICFCLLPCHSLQLIYDS